MTTRLPAGRARRRRVETTRGSEPKLAPLDPNALAATIHAVTSELRTGPVIEALQALSPDEVAEVFSHVVPHGTILVNTNKDALGGLIRGIAHENGLHTISGADLRAMLSPAMKALAAAALPISKEKGGTLVNLALATLLAWQMKQHEGNTGDSTAKAAMFALSEIVVDDMKAGPPR